MANTSIAFFDFDHTLTHKDGFTAFIKQVVPMHRKVLGVLLLWPLILAYYAGLISGGRLRPLIIFIGLKGMSAKQLTQAGEHFAKHGIPSILNPKAMAKLQWHQQQGHKVVMVSASLSAYMKPFAKSINVELICSQLSSHNGQLTGKYQHSDCHSNQKKIRVLLEYPLDIYQDIYAYGDSKEDLAMLSLASKAYLNFNAVTSFKEPLWPL
ncbi:HAD family hydrolase [Paraferrimonas sp. SM1919]|uniref:HAD family hydrolase n=1 Tax=Paraferrimonas sp. SM1919 TaxID=2662263 RepID=UPI0013D36DE3|nr:HAD family hydrolase [Paraferrimonas sp. SM1919]